MDASIIFMLFFRLRYENESATEGLPFSIFRFSSRFGWVVSLIPLDPSPLAPALLPALYPRLPRHLQGDLSPEP